MNNKRYKIPSSEKNTSRIPGKASVNSYKTSDLYLSAFLKSKGIILQGSIKKNGKVIFVFQDNGDIQDLINRYFNDSDVGVLRYKAALRDLRSIIFSSKNLQKADNQ